MKKEIFFGFIMAWSMCSHAQLSVQLVVNPTPPAKLSEWNVRANTVMLIVTNLSQAPKRVIIYSEIKTINGDVVATKIPVPGFSYSLQPGNTIFSAQDVIPLNQMSFAGSYRAGLLRTGKLPQGNYQLGVRIDSTSGLSVTQLITRNFTMTGIQLPILLAPYDNEKLAAPAAQTAITFRWSNIIKSSTELPNYNLQVFEVLPRQKAVQALRANYPLLNVIVKGSTQYIWRSQLLFNDSLHRKFIWTIRTTDGQGKLYSTTDTNAEGRSEPKVFYIETKTGKSNFKVTNDREK